MKKVVFIFKAVSEESSNINDPYTEELEKIGFKTKTISVLDFAYKNLDVLKSKLSHPELYSGVVFTSPRCVSATVKAVGGCGGLSPAWRGLQTFAVGETTERLVRDNLNLSAEGSSSGNGAALAPIILSKNLEKPLLLPCGNLKMDSLELLLSAGGVDTEGVEVYETVAHPRLCDSLRAALAAHTPSALVYFSPSGVHHSLPLLRQLELDLDTVKWVSIGPTTAAALETCGLRVDGSATKPNPPSLAAAVTAALAPSD